MSDGTPISSRDIEWSLIQRLGSRSLYCPRFTASAWWEMDLAELTDADYLVEYEIKMSRADFSRDAHKSGYVKTGPEWHNQKRTTKHELCATAHNRAPNRFYFCTPKGLLPVDIIPAWAGLIEVSRYREIDWPHCEVVKRAPLIHPEKKPHARSQIAGILCGRIRHMWDQQYFRYSAQRKKQAALRP